MNKLILQTERAQRTNTSTMDKHTPGSWKQSKTQGEPCNCRIVDENGEHVAGTYNTRPVAEREANARLIAAAPRLLAICQRLEELISSGDIPYVADWKEGVELSEAIKQATGQ